MSDKMLTPCIVKLSALGYFPLYVYIYYSISSILIGFYCKIDNIYYSLNVLPLANKYRI